MEMEINQARLSRLALVLTMLRWNEQVELTSPKPKGGQVHQQLIWNGPFLSRERQRARSQIKSNGSHRVEKGDGGLGPWGKNGRPWLSPDLPR